MKKNNLKLLISFAAITLAFIMPSSIQGAEILSTASEYKKIPGIQLQKMADDSLEAVLGAGNNVLLKISMDLKILKEPVEQEQVAVPVRLFLTDFMSTPINHASVPLEVKVDCEWILLCVLPDKPLSFESYSQFTDWLNQGHFTNENRITYDFHVDAQKAAPSLTQYLFVVPPEGYHFAGTYAVHSAKIIPDSCVPNIAYHSQRGSANTTTLTLGSVFYLNKKPYPINAHHQIFPHLMVNQKIFKRDNTKKFYHRHWLAHLQITTLSIYNEFPNDQVGNWPGIPCETYSLLRQKPGDLKEIYHLACSDGITCASIDISDKRIFLIETEDITVEESSGHLHSIVTDEEGKPLIMRYRYLQTEEERASLASLEESAEKMAIAVAARKEAIKAASEIKLQDIEKALAVAKQHIVYLTEQLEATQREVEVLRKAHEVKISQRTEAGAEPQGILKRVESNGVIKIRQEVEQRGKQEQISFWSSGIDQDMKHIKDLQNYDLTYSELLKILEAMKKYYTKEVRGSIEAASTFITDQNVDLNQYKYLCTDNWRKGGVGAAAIREIHMRKHGGQDIDTERRKSKRGGRSINKVAEIIKEVIVKKMENYEKLTGEKHPRWDEFSQM